MLAILWPLATIYAFEYMRHVGNEKRFYAFYTVSYGITLAIAYSENFLTIYLFYELLTLTTLPLVIHSMNQKAFAAGRKYLYYSFGGAALIFICLVFVVNYGDTLDFRMGGVFSGDIIAEHKNLLLQVFLIAFIGIGVKAAIFPLHGWLPSAAVAPTTVTALLHAVAVVKSGTFVAMRLTYYLFGAELLWGTWVQQTVMTMTLVTILYGSARAWHSQHLKRRLAYSTVSQLSYILFGVTLMTPEGLAAAMMYMLAHGFIKILLFYCCGAVNVMAYRHDIKDLEGLAQYMPVTFATFTIAALALIGLPPAAGFVQMR
jgi:multicomponent Na+:H+ antiporter subunit D